LASCTVPFGGGGAGADTLAIVNGKILTDAGELNSIIAVFPFVEPLPLIEYNLPTSVGAGSCVATGNVYNPPIGLTGIDTDSSGNLIVTDLFTIYNLGTAPYSAIVSQTTSLTNWNLVEGITTLFIESLNTAPTATPQTVGTNEDTDVTITLAGTDPESDPLSFTIESLPTDGKLYQTADGTTRGAQITTVPTAVTDASDRVIFVPDADENGTPYATFTFSASDGSLSSSAATVTVNVTPVADPPTIVDPADESILEDAGQQTVALTGIGPGGGTDEASQVLSIGATSDDGNVAVDSVVLGAGGTGTLKYTAADDYNNVGSPTITVTVTDDNGTPGNAVDDLSTSIDIEVSVTAVNDEPTLVDPADPAAILEDAIEQTIGLTGIDEGGGADEEAQTLTVTASSNNAALTGAITVVYTPDAETGSIKYTPQGDANGVATITVTVKDNGGTTNGGDDEVSQSFDVTVTAVNDAPIAGDDAFPISEDGPESADKTAQLLLNDNDDKDTLENGNAAPSITAVNTAGTIGTVTFASIKYDPNGQFEFLDDNSNLAAPNDVPDTAEDSFGYTLTDTGFPLPALTDTATVTVTIIGVNDAPVVIRDPDVPNANDARASAYDEPINTVQISVNVVNGVEFNDSDVDQNDDLAFSVVGGSIETGLDSVILDANDGSFIAQITSDFDGLTGFTYEATDGTATVQADVDISIFSVSFESASVNRNGDPNKVIVVDPFANLDDSVKDTVSVTLTSANTDPTESGVFTLTETTNTSGVFKVTVKFYDYPNIDTDTVGDTPPTGPRLKVAIDLDSEIDTITASYRSETTAQSTVNILAGGSEPTETEPIRWNSDVYQLGDAATLKIRDLGQSGAGSILAFIATSSQPSGIIVTLTEESAPNLGFFTSPQISLIAGSVTDSPNSQILSDASNELLARTSLLDLWTWELDTDGDGDDDLGLPQWGGASDIAIVGDWNGDGKDTMGLYRASTGLFALDFDGDGVLTTSNPDELHYPFEGAGPDAVPIVGDFNGDGTDTVGVFVPPTNDWFIDDDGDGVVDRIFETPGFGGNEDFPVVGDWTGSGVDRIGIFRPSLNLWVLDIDNDGTLSGGDRKVGPVFGNSGFGGQPFADLPVVGDWDGTGADRIGIFRASASLWVLDIDNDSLPSSGDIVGFGLGQQGDIPVVGDWDGDGDDDIGVYRPSTGGWFLDVDDDAEFTGGTDIEISGLGGVGSIPVVGDWDGNPDTDIGAVTPDPPSDFADPSDILNEFSNAENQGAQINATSIIACEDDLDLDGICDEWVDDGLGAGPGGTDIITFSVDGTTFEQECRPLIVDNDAINPPYDDTTNDPASTLDSFYTVDVCPVNDRKQMYYEVDYMVGHKPSQIAIEQVVNAFAESPIVNRDLTTGVDLFIELDESWGTHIITIPFNGTTSDPGFDQFKLDFWGTESQRSQSDADAFLTGKRQFTRYMAWVHEISDSPGASGYSEIGGNDAVISLGAFTNGTGSDPQQAGTALHEIGHNIKLHHGGDFTMTDNCKPNYLSVMNYIFQFDDKVSGRPLDFSHEKIADLDESNLDEPTGIAAVTRPGIIGNLETIIGGFDTSTIHQQDVVTTGSAIDYNRDTDTTDTGLSNKISHFDDITDCPNDAVTTLEGHDDWANIKLPFSDESTFADGLHTKASLLQHLDVQDVIKILQAVQQKQLKDISRALNQLDEGDFSGLSGLSGETGPIPNAEILAIQVQLGDIDEDHIQKEPTEFDNARNDLLNQIIPAVEDLTDITQNAIDEITAVIQIAINTFNNFLISSTAVVHTEPEATPQSMDKAIIIRDDSPVDIVITGADGDDDPLTFSVENDVNAENPTTVNQGNPNDQEAIATFDHNIGERIGSFDFRVSDGDTTSSAATVEIITNTQPVADSLSVILGEGIDSITFSITGTDGDGDTLEFAIVDLPSFAEEFFFTGTSTPTSAEIFYKRNGDFEGFDTFTFVVSDLRPDGSGAVIESSDVVSVKIITSGVVLDVFNQNPPKQSPNPGAVQKPEIEVDKDSPLHIIIACTDAFDKCDKLNEKSVFFGRIGLETTGGQGIHIDDVPFDANVKPTEPHVLDHEFKGGDPITPGFDDLELHIAMNTIGVDPADNDENGEQVLCATGTFTDPSAEFGVSLFYACNSFTVGTSHGFESEEPPPPPTETITTAIDDINVMITSIEESVDSKDLSNKNGKALTKQLSKAISELEDADTGTAIIQLNAFIDLVNTIDGDGGFEGGPLSAQDLIDEAERIILTLV